MDAARLAEIMNAAYLSLHTSRFFVGASGAMAGVSLMIFIRLLLGLVGVYKRRMSDKIATLEAFLLMALAAEVMTISRAAWMNGVPLIQGAKFKPFGFDLLIIIGGLVFVVFHFLTSLDFLPFLFNLIWIIPLSARSAFYFRMAWQRATSGSGAALPSTAPVTSTMRSSATF
jgi:hypothetical protein